MLHLAPPLEIHIIPLHVFLARLRILLSAPIRKIRINQHLKQPEQVPGIDQTKDGVFFVCNNTSFTLYRSRVTSASELPG
jgi:hypothetical protein